MVVKSKDYSNLHHKIFLTRGTIFLEQSAKREDDHENNHYNDHSKHCKSRVF